VLSFEFRGAPFNAKYSLRQQGTLRCYVSGFRPAGENRKQEDDSYHSAEG
jgi:hypothetical protein